MENVFENVDVNMENASENELERGSVEFRKRASAYDNRILTFSIVNKGHIDLQAFLSDAFHIYEAQLSSITAHHDYIKTTSIFVADFEKKHQTEHGEITEKQTFYFVTSIVLLARHSDLQTHYEEHIFDEVIESVYNAELRGSGFKLARIITLDVNVCRYDPLRASSYIDLPKFIENKGAIINVKNHDEMCFKWAILSALYPARVHAEKLFHYYKYADELNFNGINFPMQINQIGKFEKINSEKKISVNVYYYDYDKKRVCPLRLTPTAKKNHVNLFLTTDEKSVGANVSTTTSRTIAETLANGSIKLHYCWIKNMSALLSKQLSAQKNAKYICNQCLIYYDTQGKLDAHREQCKKVGTGCSIEMPTANEKWMEFVNHKHKLKAPFVIYADAESYLKELTVEEQNGVYSEDCMTTAKQQHLMFSVGYYVKCHFDDSLSYFRSSNTAIDVIRNGVDVVEWFIKELEEVAREVARLLSKSEQMKPLTLDEENAFNAWNAVCHVCGQPFAVDEKRLRDHCHITGYYRGPSHNECNLKFTDTRTIPVIMHNLSGYDSHLFITKLASDGIMKGDISVIPANAEQYISFTKAVSESTRGLYTKENIKLKFIDSCRFMPASLSELSSLLPADKKLIMKKECELDGYSGEQAAMLQRKGVFPYEYVDNIDRLKEKTLPPKEAFYSQLNGEGITDKEYQFAWKMWNKFNCKTLAEYSDLYLKTDVLLLADVFENFRQTCFEIYGLDPAHYYTAPGLSWDAMLKYTQVKIELLTDPDMLLFAERGIRGGISQCSKRYAKANNKYMGEDYKPNEDSNYLMYLDGIITFFDFWKILFHHIMKFYLKYFSLFIYAHTFLQQITYMDMQCRNHYRSVISNGCKRAV